MRQACWAQLLRDTSAALGTDFSVPVIAGSFPTRGNFADLLYIVVRGAVQLPKYGKKLLAISSQEFDMHCW